MALELAEEQRSTAQSLRLLRSHLASIADRFEGEARLTTPADLGASIGELEHLARAVEYLQVVSAVAADQQDIARVGETQRSLHWGVSPSGVEEPCEFKDTAEYLRARIGITRAEARRRLRLGKSVLPQRTVTGAVCAAALESVGPAFRDGMISSYAALQIRDAVERVRPCAEPEPLRAMEEALTAQAIESDADLLNVVIRRWESALDPDGAEPTDELLKAQQGVFLRGRRRGLHRLDIAADDEQFEYLLTVMNTATNPRTMGGAEAAGGEAPSGGVPAQDGDDAPDVGCRTRSQRLLDGLVGACQVALATDTLPATGGHRPQVMVTIDYRALRSELQECGVVPRGAGVPGAHGTAAAERFGPVTYGDAPLYPGKEGPSEQRQARRRDDGHRSSDSSRNRPGPLPGNGYSVFGGPVTARTVRKIACDADIIPVVLGSHGEVLDVGRSQRLFGVAQRRAMVARDKGCAFPDCTIPAVWTEAHHITPWFAGGTTDVSNGCLLCSFHHRLIERGNWTIEVKHGIPWFTPPPYIDPDRNPRRNKHRELALEGTG